MTTPNPNGSQGTTESNDILSERSIMLRYLRSEVQKIDKQADILQSNRKKLLEAINNLESLELAEV